MREEARAGLRGELREVVGDEAAARAERKGALDAALDADRPRTVASVFTQYRSLLMIALFVALIVGAVVALITQTWWWLLVALVLHGIGTLVVVTTAFTMFTQTESTDPRTAAALQARGVTDPDAALNQAVDAAAEDADSGEAQEVQRQRTEVAPSRRSEPTGGPEQRSEGGRS
jgi:membrane protein implicated in regulation of membrane protease activity